MLRKEKPQKPGLLDKVYPAYRKAVSWSIHHKLVVLGVSLLLLVAPPEPPWPGASPLCPIST